MNCNKEGRYCVIISKLPLQIDKVYVQTTDRGIMAAMGCPYLISVL